MDSSHTAANFHSTRWSLVMRAHRDRTVLEHLLRQYWSPVYACIRRQGYAGPDASDLTQEFMTSVVLGRGLFNLADPARGRFRTFLKAALGNFLIDQHRAGRFSKRSARQPTANDNTPQLPEIPASGAGIRGFTAFDRAWARTVVEQALLRVESACIRDGLADHWTAFETNVLAPAVRKTSPIPLDQLAGALNRASLNRASTNRAATPPEPYNESQVSNMIQTVKRRFRKALRDVIAETVSDPTEIDLELGELRSFMD